MNCDHCTFLNPPNAQICQMCSKSIQSIASNNDSDDSDGIQCEACTFLNPSEADSCEVCGSNLYDESDFSSGEEQFFGDHSMDEPIDGKDETSAEHPRKECEICYEPIGTDYFAMFECIHIFCKDCAVKYFTVQITERPILDCICPMCNVPDLHSNGAKHEEYFSLLLASLRSILDENIMNVFEKKLTEIALLSDPKFVWCIRCSSGFVNNSRNTLVHCPECRVKFCSECKKVWKSQHFNISCKQFADWQRDNDPELSNQAIGNYLQNNGIDCPKCKFKYDLARGGCIHFTCSQCKYEFCFGCRKPFSRECSFTSYCKSVGLHAHHDRNCLYFLRYKTVAELQGLLKVNNITFETSDNSNHSKIVDDKCPIELQVSTANGIVDTICNEPIEAGHAGLCKKHYTEYLIVKITKAKLETNSILSVQNYHELLRFTGIAIPLQSQTQTDSQYKAICAKLVENNIPLQR